MMARLPLLRTSERRDFKRCPQRWWWGWREGLKPQGPPNDKLWFGQGVHLALALWYKPGRIRGTDPRKTWRKFVADDIEFIRTEYTKYDPASYVEAGQYGEDLLTWYLDEYGKDPAWDVIAPEQTFEVIVPDADGNPVVRLVGTFDGVYRDLDTGELKLMEHKTAAAITLGHLPLDIQGGTYITVATFTLREQGLIGPNETVTEITYNFLRKGKRDDRPKDDQGRARNKPTKAHYLAAMPGLDAKLKVADMESEAKRRGLVVLGEVSENQPTPLFHREPVTRSRREQEKQLLGIANEVVWMQDVRDGYLPLIKNQTKDCSWDCPFYTMCELEEGADDDDVLDFRNAIYRVEDPYNDHRKSAAT
jgi:Zierdtviridae exonuclease